MPCQHSCSPSEVTNSLPSSGLIVLVIQFGYVDVLIQYSDSQLLYRFVVCVVTCVVAILALSFLYYQEQLYNQDTWSYASSQENMLHASVLFIGYFSASLLF